MMGSAQPTASDAKRRGFGSLLDEFFDGIFCVNLDTRPDRWRYIRAHLNSFGLDRALRRFPAVDIRKDPQILQHEKLLRDNFSLLGMCGCMLSHRRIVELAKAENLRNVLVFEDDVKILDGNIASLSDSLADLSELDWDIFYLGATYLFELKRAGDFLVRAANGAYATHAIAYNHTIYDQILSNLPANFEEYLASDAFAVNAFDKWLQAGPFDRDKFYGTNPIMVVQGLQESDIAFNQAPGIEQTQVELFYRNVGS